MAEAYFDIIAVVDPRFQGGTNSAVAAEITAATRAGYSVGLISCEASNLRQPMPFNNRLQRLVLQDDLTLLPPGVRTSCKLAVLHNPYTAGLLPLEPVGINAEHRLVVAHHPPVDAFGEPSYDLVAASRNAEEILGGPASWAPVGPNVRAAFGRVDDAPDLLATDWTNSIDFDAWYRRPEPRKSQHFTIGRHSRADLRKFPADRETFLKIYGDGSAAQVDLLGCPGQIRSLLDPLPQNWTLRPFHSLDVKDYLDGLDAFVYFHRKDWIEAFGYAVIEAMARGVPCVLPETLGPSFSDAATIASPDHAFDAAMALCQEPDEAREKGYEFVKSLHSFDSVVRRLKSLIGAPSKKPGAAVAIRGAQQSALLLSTNGIGMGHLTRTIAIARRFPAPFKPVIVTMSHAAAVAEDFGLHVEFIPYHAYLGVEQEPWNAFLREEILSLIDAFDARVVLFDGNSPFQGLIDACALRPSVWSVWCRRGMWQSASGEHLLTRERYFDAVIEPRDLAGAFDQGLTTTSRSKTRFVEPIRLLDKSEQIPRSMARAELGLDPDLPVLLLQLGGGNNYDMSLMRDLTIQHLSNREDLQVAYVEWLISSGSEPVPLPDNFTKVSTYPISRYINAFDATVSAVGYNSFHENFDAGLPAIYVPNENPAQDDQLARAQFAARNGAAIIARRNRPEQLVAALTEILDPERREQMAKAARRFSCKNGAVEAAGIVADLGLTIRGKPSNPAA